MIAFTVYVADEDVNKTSAQKRGTHYNWVANQWYVNSFGLNIYYSWQNMTKDWAEQKSYGQKKLWTMWTVLSVGERCPCEQK